MEISSSFDTKVVLNPKDLSKDIENIDALLQEKIRTQYESKCNRSGYVLPNTIKMLSRSIGMIEKGRYTGDILFYAEVQCKVLQPPDGFGLVGEVIRKNKMGMYVNYKDAIRIMIPRDLHIGNVEFDSVQVGDRVRVEIKKSRYQVNDTYILSVGMFLGMAGQGAEPLQEVALPPVQKLVFSSKKPTNIIEQKVPEVEAKVEDEDAIAESIEEGEDSLE
jgi:hypothetical protein